MNKPSISPDRHTFQKEGYIERMNESGDPPDEEQLSWFDKAIEYHKHKFDEPESRVNNMEYDLLTTDWILKKVRDSDTYAQNLYAAMCNMQFQKLDVMPILKNELWSASWRYSGGIIADMRQEGDYINWYCSGIGNEGLGNGDFDGTKNYVAEGVVTDEIKEDLQRLGWTPVEWEDEE
jgi:hypothetical protein